MVKRKNMVKRKKYVSFGISSIDEDTFRTIGNDSLLKPSGCLYGYQYTSNKGYISRFEEWCDTELVNRGSLRKCIMYNLSDDANIKEINSWADIHELIKQYPLIKTAKYVEKGAEIDMVVGAGIDYAKLSKDYDVLEFTEKVVTNTDLPDKHYIDVTTSKIIPEANADKYKANGLIKLDCDACEVACICIFNPNVIKNVSIIRTNKTHLLDENEMFDEISKEMDAGISTEKVIQILNEYYCGKMPIKDLIAMVETSRKDNDRFNDLLDRIDGLLKVQIAGNIDLEPDIRAAVEKAYKMVPEQDNFEFFQKCIRNTLETNILGSAETVKKPDIMDEMAEAFGGFFN